MSRKRGKTGKSGKKHGAAAQAVPEVVADDNLAEGSAPHRRADVDSVTTVEDVVTTDDIETTDDVVTADDVVATAGEPTKPPADDDEKSGAAAADGDAVVEPAAQRADGDGAADAAMASDGELAVADDAPPVEGGDVAASGEGGDPAASSEGGEPEDDDAGVVFPTSAATMDALQFRHLVEALIFASDRPLTVQRLRQLTRVGDVRRIEHALTELAEDFKERGLVLQQVSGGYQFRTRTQFSAWVQQLIAGRPVRLSRAQLETLAIIAYRQPITRPEIDDIRGVDSSATLKLLIDRMLIRALGKREEVGRPTLYGTTKEFLDFFSLGDLRELPTLREYSELTAESRKVMSDRLGIPVDDDGDGNNGNGGDDGGGDGGAGGGDAGPFGGSEPSPSEDAPATGFASDDGDATDGASFDDDGVEASEAAGGASDGVEVSERPVVAFAEAGQGDGAGVESSGLDDVGGDAAGGPVDGEVASFDGEHGVESALAAAAEALERDVSPEAGTDGSDALTEHAVEANGHHDALAEAGMEGSDALTEDAVEASGFGGNHGEDAEMRGVGDAADAQVDGLDAAGSGDGELDGNTVETDGRGDVGLDAGRLEGALLDDRLGDVAPSSSHIDPVPE